MLRRATCMLRVPGLARPMPRSMGALVPMRAACSPCGHARRWASDGPAEKVEAVEVDRTKLKVASFAQDDGKQPVDGTPLLAHLRRVMEIRGPLTMAQYMREALLNPSHGYYTQTGDVFGKRGDFVTAPEISQMFGELVGLWALQAHAGIASSTQPMHVVELGPGKGTLSLDLLRAVRTASKDQEVVLHLIDASPALQKRQAKTLGVPDEAVAAMHDSSISDTQRIQRQAEGAIGAFGVRVHWQRALSQVGGEGPVYIVAQELFDALPVHVLHYTKSGWREVLVDVDPEGEHGLKQVLAPAPTVASRALEQNRQVASLSNQNLPEEGERVEVCLDGMALMQDIGTLVSQRKGAALAIDYGENFALQDSIRAIRNHEYEHIFAKPGEADISAYVDFSALKACLSQLPDGHKVHAHGPVTQGSLLKELGIEARLVALLCDADDARAESLISSYQRLVDGEEMGTIYKAIALSSSPAALLGFS